jgi:hypothetical protein
MQVIEKLGNMLVPECMDRFDFENDFPAYHQVCEIFPYDISFIRNSKGCIIADLQTQACKFIIQCIVIALLQKAGL